MENGAVISGALVPASCSQVAGRPVKPVKLPELLGFTDFSQLPQAKPQSHKEAFSVKPSAICLQPTNRSFKRKKKKKKSISRLEVSLPPCSLLARPRAAALQQQQFSAGIHHRSARQRPKSAVLTLAKVSLVQGEPGLSKDCRNGHLASIRAQDQRGMACIHP